MLQLVPVAPPAPTVPALLHGTGGRATHSGAASTQPATLAVALEEALALAHPMPYPYAEAKALYVYGLLQAARGGPEQAREQYGAALAILVRLGERLYAEQVEQALAGVNQL